MVKSYPRRRSAVARVLSTVRRNGGNENARLRDDDDSLARKSRSVSRWSSCVELGSTYRGGPIAPTVVSAAAVATSVVVILQLVRASSTFRETS